MGRITFGTDGWRAVIAEDFTVENVQIVAQAVADYLKCQPINSLLTLVGYDARFLSEKFAETVASVLAANDIPVILTPEITPTPVISFAIKEKKAAGAIIITASHNPPQYNGIKFKAHYAGSADENITREIENFLYRNAVASYSLENALREGKVQIEDLSPKYFSFIRSYVEMEQIRQLKEKIVVDPMYGTTGNYFARLLPGNCLILIHNARNPYFGGLNPEPIPPHLDALAEKVRQEKATIGIATDGDGDRIGVVDETGSYLTPHQVFGLLLLHLLRHRKWKGAVVKTVSTTMLVDRISRQYGLKLYITPVGFKHICQLMLQEDILLGGEESGGLGFKAYIPERDGILSALLLLEMIAVRNKTVGQILQEVEEEFGRFRYRRVDLYYPEEKRDCLIPEISSSPPGKLAQKTVKNIDYTDGIKFLLDNDSWLLIRPSGTEPLVRIYAEAESEEEVAHLVSEGKNLVLSI